MLCPKFAQAQTKMNRNDAPVSLELPSDWRMMDAHPPQKKSEITIDDTQTVSLNSSLQAPIDKMTQDTWHQSRGSSESYTPLLTDLQKSPLESPGGGENRRGCNVSSTALKSQVDTAVKSVGGTEIQVDEKLESMEEGKLLVQDDSEAANEKIIKMETESAVLPTNVEHEEKETAKRELMSNTAEERSSQLQNVKTEDLEPAIPHLTNNLEQMIDFREIPKPASKVISIAELLRAQIKALDSTPGNSVPTVPVQADSVQEPATTGTETCEGVKEDDRKCYPDVEKSMSDRKMEKTTDHSPPANIKATLMEIYHQLNTYSEQVQTQGVTSPPVQALQKPLVVTPVSVLETTGVHGSDKKSTESVMDIGKDVEASTPLVYPAVSLTEGETVGLTFQPLASEDDLTVSPTKSSGQTSNITVLEQTKDEPVQLKDIEKLTPEIKLNSKSERVNTEMNSAALLDQYTVEGHNGNSSSVKQLLFPTESEKQKNQLLQQDSSMVEEFSSNPTPEASPSLKRRNCVSPIPSATPQELASGARRKILTPKYRPEEATEATSPVENQTQKVQSSKLSPSPVSLSTSPGLSRRSPLLQPPGERTSPVERRSPLFSRRKTALETQAPNQQPTEEVHTPKTDEKPADKNKHNPFKGKMISLLLFTHYNQIQHFAQGFLKQNMQYGQDSAGFLRFVGSL